MLRKIAIGAVLVLAVLLAVILTRPDSFRIERTVTIAAPAPLVFAQIDDMRRWRGWSPFETAEPDLRRTYSGAPTGVGSVYEYQGKKMGAGRMTIVGSAPAQHVVLRAEFLKPMHTTNRVDFTLAPAEGGVAVTWAMSGPMPFLSKAISLVMDMDRVVGGEFEKGLTRLKQVTEAEARAAAPAAAPTRAAS